MNTLLLSSSFLKVVVLSSSLLLSSFFAYYSCNGLFVEVPTTSIHTQNTIRRQQQILKRKNYKRGFNHHLDPKKITFQNLTCDYYIQPLDHFSVSTLQTFPQRYCYYDFHDPYNNNNDDEDSLAPIFFYTGNESPLDEYTNNTGLMYELAAKPKFKALVVFAEHRFEGKSVPNYFINHYHDYNNIDNNDKSIGCFPYLTSSQALADFVNLISHLNPNHNRPVIAFGGSYGGMLSAWLRMKYPDIVVGAIASSAPIFGLPLTMYPGNITNHKNYNDDDDDDPAPNDGTMDGAFHIVGNAIQTTINIHNHHYNYNHNNDTSTTTTQPQQEQPLEQNTTKNYCYENLLAAWPLLTLTGQSQQGRTLLSDAFNLCQPLQTQNDVLLLLEWAQSPWFDLAEGDYPYESSYIPFAIGEGDYKLPPWPLQYACESSGLVQDWNIRVMGDLNNVLFDIVWYHDENNNYNNTVQKQTPSSPPLWYDEQHPKIRRSNHNNDNPWLHLVHVNWNNITSNDENFAEFQTKMARDFFATVKNAVAVWFNMTGNLECFDVLPAPTTAAITNVTTIDKHPHLLPKQQYMTDMSRKLFLQKSKNYDSNEEEGSFFSSSSNIKSTPNKKQQACNEKLKTETVWTSLICNEYMNLIMTYAKGVGRDPFWPPSHSQNMTNYLDTIRNRTLVEEQYDEICADPFHYFGYPNKENVDPMSHFLDNEYGGLRSISSSSSHSNIIFANGLLDPWSAGGVYSRKRLNHTTTEKSSSSSRLEKSYPIVHNLTDDGSIIAILLDLGGHHLDLMWSDFDHDPPCAVNARIIQEQYIDKWVDAFYKSKNTD